MKRYIEPQMDVVKIETSNLMQASSLKTTGTYHTGDPVLAPQLDELLDDDEE